MIDGAVRCLQLAPATGVQRDMYGSRYVELAGGWRVVCHRVSAAPAKELRYLSYIYIDG